MFDLILSCSTHLYTIEVQSNLRWSNTVQTLEDVTELSMLRNTSHKALCAYSVNVMLLLCFILLTAVCRKCGQYLIRIFSKTAR
jgi:hypothetical protein